MKDLNVYTIHINFIQYMLLDKRKGTGTYMAYYDHPKITKEGTLFHSFVFIVYSNEFFIIIFNIF